MATASMDTPPAVRRPWYRGLYVWVLVGIAAGVLVGWRWPGVGAALEPLGNTFVSALNMVTGPVIFLTVTGGIAGADSLRGVGRVGVKALVYFQAATLVSLGLGLLAANVFQPGVGVHGVTGAGFVILAATLSVLGTLPAAGIMPVFGVDKFLSECRALTNVCGNTIASMVVARWEGRLDSAEVRRRLAAKPAGPVPAEVPEPRPRGDHAVSVPLPPEFTYRTVDADGVAIHTAVAGDGPPVLLLHGYPQTHLIWHRVAPVLAKGHTVVLADLRGYGDSAKPAPGPTDAEYAKRAMAHDQLLVMRELGFDRFAVVGHDRGARVGHRLALDEPAAVRGLAVLDIVPTRHTFAHVDAAFALGYYHWFFLAAGNGMAERLLGNDPEFWIRTRMNSRHSGGTAFDEAAVREYVRCFSDPAAIGASCSDYRAAAAVDLVHDNADFEAGRRVECPLLALWGATSFVGRHYDVLSVWRDYAADVRGRALPSDHYVPEEAPSVVAEELAEWLADLER